MPSSNYFSEQSQLSTTHNPQNILISANTDISYPVAWMGQPVALHEISDQCSQRTHGLRKKDAFLWPNPQDAAPASKVESEPSAPVDVVSDAQPTAETSEEPPPLTPEAVADIDEAKESLQPESTPAELLFAAVRAALDNS